MAQDHPPSSSSSVTNVSFDDNEKHAADPSFVKVKPADDVEQGDELDERAEFLPADEEKPAPAKPDNSTRTAVLWMVVNTLATIGIVSSTAPSRLFGLRS